MDKQKENPYDSQLHWFWRLTTKWWFFPLLYILLNLATLTLAGNLGSLFKNFSFYKIFTLIMMGSGFYLVIFPIILPIINPITATTSPVYSITNPFVLYTTFYYYLLYFILFIFPIIIIQYYKHYKNRTLKWLVIILLSLTFVDFLISTAFYTSWKAAFG